jgi:hypothetical protein
MEAGIVGKLERSILHLGDKGVVQNVISAYYTN